MRSMLWLGCVLVAATACGHRAMVTGDAGSAGPDAADAGSAMPAPTVIVVSAPAATSASAAYRDGDGPWRPADLTSGMFAFQVSSGRYSVAIGCIRTSPPRVDVYELGTADTTHLEPSATCTDAQATVAGSLFEAGSEGARLAFGDDETQVYASNNDASYALQPPAGTHDLVAVRLLGNGLDADRVLVARGVVAPANATIDADFDFEAAGTIDLEQHAIAISPMSGGITSVTSELVTASGTRAQLSIASTSSARAIPASALAPGDLHLLTMRHGAVGPPGPYEEIIRTVRIVADSAVVLPAGTLTPPTLAGAMPGTDEQYTVTWPSHPAGALYALGVAPQTLAGTAWTVEVSDAYAGSAFVVQTPDLGGVSGWPSSLHLLPGPQVNWSVEARQGAPVEQLLREVPTIEADVFVVGWLGLFTP